MAQRDPLQAPACGRSVRGLRGRACQWQDRHRRDAHRWLAGGGDPAHRFTASQLATNTVSWQPRGARVTGTDLVVASNRGPSDNHGASGLLSSMSRALKNHAATWVSVVPAPVDPQVNTGAVANSYVRLHNVVVEADQFEAYYNRISNSVLYLLHVGLLDDVCTAPSMLGAWEAYKAVNRHVAASCISLAGVAGHVLVQDYHLSLAPAMIRAARPDVGVAHFSHCTWAAPADFSRLPRALADELISGMLGADLLGFYARRWANDFLRSCALAGFRVSLEDGVVWAPDGRCVPVRASPLGVDPVELRREAISPAAMRHRRMLEELSSGRKLVVRVERMDPVKNLARGLDAFAAFLREHPRMHDRITHFVLACTTRPGIAAYERYRAEVITRVRAINTDRKSTRLN